MKRDVVVRYIARASEHGACADAAKRLLMNSTGPAQPTLPTGSNAFLIEQFLGAKVAGLPDRITPDPATLSALENAVYQVYVTLVQEYGTVAQSVVFDEQRDRMLGAITAIRRAI